MPDDALTAVLVFLAFFLVANFAIGVFIMTVTSDVNAKLDRIQAGLGNLGGDVRGLQTRIDELLAQGTEGISRDDATAISNRAGELATAIEDLAALTPEAPAAPADPPPADPPADPAPAADPATDQ